MYSATNPKTRTHNFERMIRLVTCIFPLLLSFSLLADPDYQRFEENGKIGLKDQQGTVVLPASFDALGWSDGNFSVIGQITGFRKHDRWGLINLKKEFITEAEFASLTYPGGDRVIVSRWINPYTIKFGCLDLQGNLVVPFSYDGITLHGLRGIAMIKNGTRYEYGLIDLNNKNILPVSYQNISPIGSLRYAVQDFHGKLALLSEEGKWITEFNLDSISDFRYDLAVTHQGWRRGVIDRNGETKVPPVYREIRVNAPGQVSVRKADEWKIIGTDFHELKRIEADELTFSDQGLAYVRLNGKTGLVDENLKPRWNAEFDYIGPVRQNLTVVGNHGKFGLSRLNQTEVLPLEFDSLCVAGNFVRAMQRKAGTKTWELYDTVGIRKSISKYEVILPFNGSFLPVKNRGYWGALDRYGKETIACAYDSLLQVREGLMVVMVKGNYGIITIDDHWKLTPQPYPIELLNQDGYIERRDSMMYLKDFTGNALYFTDNPVRIYPDHLVEHLPDGVDKEINFHGQIVGRQPLPRGDQSGTVAQDEETFPESEGFIGIRRDGKFGFIDRRGRLRIANRYDGIGAFHEGLSPMKLVGKWGYINTADEIVIQPTFDTVEGFEQGVATVSRNGKCGLINAKGKELLELRYDSIRRLPNRLFLLSLNDRKGLADHNGRILIEPRFDYLAEVANGHLIAKQNNLYGLLSRDGMSIMPLQYTKLIYVPQKSIFIAELKTEWESLEVK